MRRLAPVLVMLASVSSLAMAESYNAAADFSIGSNPTGVWTYGYRNVAASTSITLLTNDFAGDLSGWDSGLPFPNNYPRVVSNQSAGPLFWGTNVPLQTGELGYHPGPSGEFCVVRFTAPSAGDWAYAAGSTSLDNLSDGMSIFVVVNGAADFSGGLLGGISGATISHANTVSLAAGDTIDFVVGTATGNNTGDTAMLDATIRAVPTPGAALLLVGGLVGVRRRR